MTAQDPPTRQALGRTAAGLLVVALLLELLIYEASVGQAIETAVLAVVVFLFGSWAIQRLVQRRRHEEP